MIDLTTTMASAAGTIVAGVTIYKYVVRPASACALYVKKAAAAVNTLVAEMSPNGGGSLRDAVNRIEHAVYMADHRIRSVKDALGLAMFESDRHGSYVYVSTRWCELGGISIDEARGCGWITGVSEIDRKKVREEWDRAVSGNRRFEMHFRMGSGKLLVRGVASIVNGHDGNPIGHLGILHEIADQP